MTPAQRKAYSNSIAFYMTPEATRDLIDIGREMQAKLRHKRACAAAKALYGERRTGSDRRFHTMEDKLAFEERRHRTERRWDRQPERVDLAL